MTDKQEINTNEKEINTNEKEINTNEQEENSVLTQKEREIIENYAKVLVNNTGRNNFNLKIQEEDEEEEEEEKPLTDKEIRISKLFFTEIVYFSTESYFSVYRVLFEKYIIFFLLMDFLLGILLMYCAFFTSVHPVICVPMGCKQLFYSISILYNDIEYKYIKQKTD